MAQVSLDRVILKMWIAATREQINKAGQHDDATVPAENTSQMSTDGLYHTHDNLLERLRELLLSGTESAAIYPDGAASLSPKK